MPEQTYAKGLEGVIAAETRICQIDGDRGALRYRGYSIQDLAKYADYETTCYLLLYEKLPNRKELDAFSQSMKSCRGLAPEVLSMIRDFPPNGAPMEACGISTGMPSTSALTWFHRALCVPPPTDLISLERIPALDATSRLCLSANAVPSRMDRTMSPFVEESDRPKKVPLAWVCQMGERSPII